MGSNGTHPSLLQPLYLCLGKLKHRTYLRKNDIYRRHGGLP
jgi:hypothetical protein